MPDDPRRNRLDEIGRQKAALDAEALKLIRELQDEMMRIAGIPKADRERHMNMSDAERAEIIGLHPSTESGTLGTMQLEKSWGAAIAAAKRKPRWPFARALDKAGISLPEWARARGAKVENVKSWLKNPGKGGRPVPRLWADRIAKEFPSVRAVPESWPNGIRD